MIKKFEEFINESYQSNGLNSEDIKKLKNILIELFDMTEQETIAILNRFENNIYSFEEIEKILYKFSECPRLNHAYAQSLLKSLFDKRESVKGMQVTLDYMSKTKNEGKPFPVVIDINGKLITGEVYYSEALNAYAKDEDDFIEAGDEWLSIQANEEGILDDDQPDWVSDNWDMLEIYEVDLDKEYLDKETNRWTKR